ncbi:MAG: alpha/beta fold hydrolase [Candidatus Deferrimicrobiaceae bacterium]
MPYTEAPGFRMYYETQGGGEPLLLINGLGSDSTEWLFQFPAFARCFLVVAFDNRGAGRSDPPPGPYSTAQMADDAAALLTHLGANHAHVLGVSLGGMVAQEVALRHPEQVWKLVLACTAPGGEGSVRPAPEVLKHFVRSPGGDPEEEVRRVLPFLYSERYLRDHPEEIEEFVRRRLAGPVCVEGHAAQLAAAMSHSAWERLTTIGAPTLVIAGDGDRVVPTENSRRIAERIPDAKLVILPGAPHRLFAENAEDFNRAVISFLLSGRPESP